MSDLGAILDNEGDDEALAEQWTRTATPADAPATKMVGDMHCVECEDPRAESLVRCDTCTDVLCAVCFRSLHLKGNRQRHVATPLTKEEEAETNNDIEVDDEERRAHDEDGQAFFASARFVPLRLNAKERSYLRLLESSVFVSDYVDKIDVQKFAKGSKRVFAQLREICSVLTGIMFKHEYKLGQDLVADKDFVKYEDHFRAVFELGRRYKILNPERLRSEYGKLMYVLQDAQVPEVREAMGFSLVGPIKTVDVLLNEHGPAAVALLQDPRLEVATRAITYNRKDKDRTDYDLQVKKKYATKKRLIQEYATRTSMSKDQVELVLNSIGDNRSFLLENLVPVQEMLALLRKYFKPEAAESDAFSLAIAEGEGGARMTHSHLRQYRYVEQSLELWAEILENFFELWSLADQSLLSEEHRYELTDTGQGNQRVQPSPLVERRMRVLLTAVQERCEDWVGSSVVHLGDRNVPNALHFIDKYTQVARILAPIVTTLNWVADHYDRKTRVEVYIDEAFGNLDDAIKTVLTDFFRYGFDGSGADNWFDAGSCLDGRLTSSWHWCQQIESKRFYPMFLLAGFQSFDGAWGE